MAEGPQGQEMKSWMLSFSVPFSCNLVSLGIRLFPSFVLTQAVGVGWGLLLEPRGRLAADGSLESLIYESRSRDLFPLLASLHAQIPAFTGYVCVCDLFPGI